MAARQEALSDEAMMPVLRPHERHTRRGMGSSQIEPRACGSIGWSPPLTVDIGLMMKIWRACSESYGTAGNSWLLMSGATRAAISS